MFASLAGKLGNALPGGGHDSHSTLDSIHHSLRSFGQQYSSSTTPVQRIITAEKGIALDLDSLARDAKAFSKEFYTWGAGEADDIKDVTDRLAYLNFVSGSLAGALSEKIDSGRNTFKALRSAEAAMLGRRNARGALQLQITRIEQDQPRGMEKRLADLKQKLKEATDEDQPQEAEIELLKRQAIRESETQKWEAIREFGEKLVLLAQGATPVLGALPKFPPTEAQPYTGTLATGAARAALQRALDNYKPGDTHLPISTSVDLSRSETRSFGVSHAKELSSIALTDSGPVPRPSAASPTPSSGAKPTSSNSVSKASVAVATPPAGGPSPPIDPTTLNLAPAPIPNLAPQPESPVAAPVPLHPTILPTVAETGLPLAAGAAGPGPASGSLHDIKAASDSAGPRTDGGPGDGPSVPAYGTPARAGSSGFESAEAEKRRLAQAYSEAAGQPSGSRHETAEEEKLRLERERNDPSTSGPSGKGNEYDDLPPSYQD
ncbi:Eukaryotic translation initiation factor 4e [Mycena kentingensis (nom. inval.)]|nr:Eukaryotic translation initiation factor 4e [Mycena kentingensis (nom. inval.)]